MPSMKWIAIGVVAFIVIVIAILGIYVLGTQRDLVNRDNSVEQQWGNVQNAYQRRADLIPNLVATVQGAATFEMTTQTNIAEMRSQAGQIKTQVYNAKTPAELDAADVSMGNVLSRLMVVVENYPELKSNQNFLDLQSQIEGTENRIQYERTLYNEKVKDYKNLVQMMPSSFVANMFNFDATKWKTFEATQKAQEAPTVTFSFTPAQTAAPS